MLQSERNKPCNSQRGGDSLCDLLSCFPANIIKTTITTNHQSGASLENKGELSVVRSENSARLSLFGGCVWETGRSGFSLHSTPELNVQVKWGYFFFFFCRNVSVVVLAERTELITPPKRTIYTTLVLEHVEGAGEKIPRREMFPPPVLFPETSLDKKIKSGY